MSVKRLMEERDRLQQEMGAIQAKLDGIEYAIKVSGGISRATGPRTKPGSVRSKIKRILKAAGSDGATLADIKAKSPKLKPAALSVTLSHMKKKGEVKHAGKKYTLAQ